MGLPPIPIPDGSGGAPVPSIAPAQIPDWLKLMVALLVVGAVAEAIYKVSPGASYAFIFFVVAGYAAAGTKTDALSKFLGSLNIVANNK